MKTQKSSKPEPGDTTGGVFRPHDPFSRAIAKPFPGVDIDAAGEQRQVAAAVARASTPTPPPAAAPVAVPAPAAAEFVAALFSTGELVISVGADSVRLSREHQQLLAQFVCRFED